MRLLITRDSDYEGRVRAIKTSESLEELELFGEIHYTGHFWVIDLDGDCAQLNKLTVRQLKSLDTTLQDTLNMFFPVLWDGRKQIVVITVWKHLSLVNKLGL